jgi:hypothetical protein
MIATPAQDAALRAIEVVVLDEALKLIVSRGVGDVLPEDFVEIRDAIQAAIAKRRGKR